MRPMETLQDLIDEAKARTVLWVICIYALSYFITHTSKSMWMNIPISIVILAVFRYLSNKVELRWRVPPTSRQSYLSQLAKKQLSVTDSRLSAVPASSRWRRKIGSPPVEAAMNDFINKLLQDFVVDLWYSDITPDKEAPELMRTIILDVLGEISARVKEINLVDLLTRDVVDLVGNQLDLYRKSQSDIGVDIMGTLSFEERDERLKQHLIASKELHPALISAECEHKVLQCMVGGILALVMKSQEAKNPLVRCISRELLTCLVLQPVINLASPAYINELIEYIFLATTDSGSGEVDIDTSRTEASSVQDPSISVGKSKSAEPESRMVATSNQSTDLMVVKSVGKMSADGSDDGHLSMVQKDSAHVGQPRPADWAVVLEAATKRRSEVLAPENLENMWTRGRNYNRKCSEFIKAGNSCRPAGSSGKELQTNSDESSTVRERSTDGGNFVEACENEKESAGSNNGQLKRSSSSPNMNRTLMSKNIDKQEQSGELISHIEGLLHTPKIRCRVVGAYFEKIGSKSFAVYSIAVTDAENKTWFVKRRYRNFERLHRHLKDIPNYSLHLPPKRFLSSSIDDSFVHQRCILLDKYLQDLLAIANIAEQHEVWDFLSVSSKNYSFGKSTSVMKTLAVNVDDAMDDIVRQFKGVSDGLLRKVSVPPSTHLTSSPVAERTLALTWNEEEASRQSSSYSNMESSHSVSDEEVHDEDHSSARTNGWHSDNELNAKDYPPRVVKRIDESKSLDSQRNKQPDQYDRVGLDKVLTSNNSAPSDLFEDPLGMPPEWTPPNVSVPLLNLVDKIFQLKRRGWLRRQVFWISKQILQLMMEDAIDDWILRQIHRLRNDEIVACGIRWIHNVLWPNGTFFIKIGSSQVKVDDVTSSQQSGQKKSRTSGDGFSGSSSFELQLEAARRASDVKKMILGGAPSALVSLIGHRQYERCAKDIYYFIQSTICVKQLAYGILELLVVTIFPELRDLIQDLHEKPRTQIIYGR